MFSKVIECLKQNIQRQSNSKRPSSTKQVTKSSSAAGRTRRRLGNTSTCPHVHFGCFKKQSTPNFPFIVIIQHFYFHFLISFLYQIYLLFLISFLNFKFQVYLKTDPVLPVTNVFQDHVSI